MDLGLSTAANESAHDPPMKLKPRPPLEQEHGHGHEICSNGAATTGDEGQASAHVTKHAADTASSSSSPAGDVELQRRKAALLQQVSVPSPTLPYLQAPVIGHTV